MRILRALGLGTLFLIVTFVAYGIPLAIIGKVQISHHTAVGVSALIAGLEEATIYNLIFWMIALAAYGLAFWLTRRNLQS